MKQSHRHFTQIVHRSHHNGLIWVYLNGKCNFTCPYCLDGRNNIEGRQALNERFLEKLHELQSMLGYALIFTGGEPLIEIKLLKALYEKFKNIPKSIQTNGSLTGNAIQILPHFGKHDWLSISIHDDTYAREDKRCAVEATIGHATKAGINIFIQLMCSPSNVNLMLARADTYQAMRHRVALRRLFEYDPCEFARFRERIEQMSTDWWAAPAFFGDPWSATQPFKAMTVYLNGDITAVCKTEIKIGNLYSGYDLKRIDDKLENGCEAICHCCSCIWATQEWGFA